MPIGMLGNPSGEAADEAASESALQPDEVASESALQPGGASSVGPVVGSSSRMAENHERIGIEGDAGFRSVAHLPASLNKNTKPLKIEHRKKPTNHDNWALLLLCWTSLLCYCAVPPPRLPRPWLLRPPTTAVK